MPKSNLLPRYSRGSVSAFRSIMRFWITPFFILIFFSACSRDTAFEYFTKLDSQKERAVVNLRRITLREQNETTALISIIYLNPVEPKLYIGRPNFLVALYDKRNRTLDDYNITLNGQPSLGMTELDDNCSLRRLMPLDNPWNRYYQVIFPYQDDANLTLRFETHPSLTGEVIYDTDQ
jgi:hypothetical protein